MRYALWVLAMLTGFISCKTSGPSLFGKRSPHEQYAARLEEAGLKNSLLGAAWFKAAELSLSNPFNINLPYKELGYFAAELPKASGLRFNVKKGERITVTIIKRSSNSFTLYAELWRPATANTSLKLLEALDTSRSSFTYDADEDEALILRIQPQLAESGEYTVTIHNGPSLAFPVQVNKQVISSFWGADRDGGARRHEGVDIFAPKGTPLLAAADGVITRVEETNIGGKVIWLRPAGKNYHLYYAHLDEQLAAQGKQVKAGEIIGKVGNTGNAKTTGPHLHFGIYAQGGAIDPLLFIQPSKKPVPEISADIVNVGQQVRTAIKTNAYTHPDQNAVILRLEKNIPLKVQSALDGWYKVTTPADTTLFIASTHIQQLKVIRKTKSETQQPLYDQPSMNAARKMMIEKGEVLEVLGEYNSFHYVQYKSTFGWVKNT